MGNPSMDLKIEKLYRSRQPLERDEGKVRIEILYYKRNYREGPVPGGFVVESSSGSCKAFMVHRNNNLESSLRRILFDAIIGIGYHQYLERKLIHQTRLAVQSLPDSTVVNGARIVPELLVCIDLEIRILSMNRLRSDPEDTVSTRPIRRRRLNDNINDNEEKRNSPASASAIKQLERIRVNGKEEEEEEWRCSLCLESGGLELIRLPCKHIFHNNCIIKWLLKSNSCPLCRSRV